MLQQLQEASVNLLYKVLWPENPANGTRAILGNNIELRRYPNESGIIIYYIDVYIYTHIMIISKKFRLDF